jgi:23S rRNA pseudouridine2605 synthase
VRLGPGEVTLERALSKLGIASRADARALVSDGRVSIDGRIERNARRPVVPERARILIDGRPARAAARLTILLNKPRGAVTTRRDPEGRTTVYDSLAGVEETLMPVGRLDAATTGLLLFTNDTRLADWLTDPQSAVPRVYIVTVRGQVGEDAAAQMRAGVEDRGERLAASAVEVLKSSGRESHLRLELTEGRNREVRRLCAGIGHEVTRLKRVAFGGLELGALATGAWRRVADAELAAAFPGVALRPAALLQPYKRKGPEA